jgi:serine protease AprX
VSDGRVLAERVPFRHMRVRSDLPLCFLWVALLALLCTPASPFRLSTHYTADAKLDALLRERAHEPRGASQVIIRTVNGLPADPLIRIVGGSPGRELPSLGAQVARVPDSELDRLAGSPDVISISSDRPVRDAMDRSAATIGARWVVESLGFDGSGIGVATIDSGVSAWHEDLASGRVVHFADFVNAQVSPYDDYGHGTHVAGIIAGSGHASDGARRGVASGANLIVLKALDSTGGGYSSNVIAALDYAIANRETYNIRVINLSVAAGVYESYDTDPLTLAARRAVEAGIVVVAAAGNLGRSHLGRTQYGGIASPGNAPWVLTVGASNHKGTIDRADDSVAAFSSRGPAAIDIVAKPDLVAPGVGIESMTEPSSALFATHPSSRLWGTVDTITEPYLSLTGTSMAAPIVAGTVALMLEANPSLTPNAVKGILQFTAETHAAYDHLTQGAGFLNARGAVELARAFSETTAENATESRDPVRWNRHIIWGNVRMAQPQLDAQGNAWRLQVTWGALATSAGEPITWAASCDPAMSSNCAATAVGTPCDPAGRSCASEPDGSDVVVLEGLCAHGECDASALATHDAEAVGRNDGRVVAGNVPWGTRPQRNN